jgi:hypothetical protein
VDSFRLELLGAARDWATIHPEQVRLFPGHDSEAVISFHPPADDPPLAGLVPFAVKATPVDDPANTTVEESGLRVAPLARLSAHLVPVTSVGCLWGRHRLWVTNGGNVALPIRLDSTDPDGRLRIRLRPARFVTEAGSARRIRVRVGGPHWFLTGPDRHHRFTVTARSQGATDVVVPAAYRQHALIKRSVLAALAALAVLSLLAYFLLRPAIGSTAQPASHAHPATAR